MKNILIGELFCEENTTIRIFFYFHLLPKPEDILYVGSHATFKFPVLLFIKFSAFY